VTGFMSGPLSSPNYFCFLRTTYFELQVKICET
jgi:hypothetical protein